MSTDDSGVDHDSGFIMYPGGHARNTFGPDDYRANLKDILNHPMFMFI